MTRKCWCGKEATHLIRNSLPGADVITYTCEQHKHVTYDAVKWRLVSLGIWMPNTLTLEWIPAH